MSDRLSDALPLSRFSVFESPSVDRARAFVAGVFCDHVLQPLGRTSPAPSRMHHVKLNTMSASYLRYGCGMRIAPREFESFYLLQIPIRGASVIGRGAERAHSLPGSATMLSPHERVDMRWAEGCEKIIFRIERRALDAQLASLLDAPLTRPLSFALALRLDQGPLLTLWRLLENLCSDLDANPDSAWRAPDGAAAMERLAYSLLLAHAPHNYSAHLQRPVPTVAPHRLRLVEEYIEAHYDEPITIETLTAASGVSARTLFENYRLLRGISPMQFVQKYRCRRVREALLRAAPDASVTAIALDCGVTQLGRFAGYYRREYGETPSETLRKARLRRRLVQ